MMTIMIDDVHDDDTENDDKHKNDNVDGHHDPGGNDDNDAETKYGTYTICGTPTVCAVWYCTPITLWFTPGKPTTVAFTLEGLLSTVTYCVRIWNVQMYSKY